MDLLAPFRRLGAVARRLFGPAEVRLVLPIFLIAVLGPLGESIDVALFSELELEILASDLGLEFVASALVYGSHLVLMLLGAIAIAVAVTIRRDGTLPLETLASCGGRRPIKVPIG